MHWLSDVWALILAYPLSASISGGVLLACALFQGLARLRRRGPWSPAGVDPLAKTLVDCVPNSRFAPIAASLAWFAVCFVVDIVLPLLPGRGAGWEVVQGSLQGLLAINYVVLVPAMLWCYIAVVCDLRTAGRHAPARRGGVLRFVWWSILWVVTVVFQYVTIRTQIAPCSSTPPYLWVVSKPVGCGSPLHLNWQGAAHAALRGLDAMMALGFMATIIVAAVDSRQIGGGSVLETHGTWESRHGRIRCKPALRHLAFHLLLGGSLAVTIASLHYVTIKLHRWLMSPGQASAAMLAQFVGSTWVVWCVISIISAGIAFWLIFGIYLRASVELTQLEADAVSDLVRQYPQDVQADIGAGRERATHAANQPRLDEYWRNHDRIRRFFAERANPYPLPSLFRPKLLRSPVVLSLILSVAGNAIYALLAQGFFSIALVTFIVNTVYAAMPAAEIPCVCDGLAEQSFQPPAPL